MTRITYVEHDGTGHAIDVKPGMSVMEGAVRNNVPGIVAECGGCCSCATCHVYVAAEWQAIIGPPLAAELDTLEHAAEPGEGSRLSCQIKVRDELDGLVVRMPENQY